MSHQSIKDWIEEYAEGTLSPENAQDVEQHLALCSDCRDQLKGVSLTRHIVRAARLEDGPVPLPGFARSLMERIRAEQTVYSFWSPLRLMALKAIPVMVLLAVFFGLLAYQEITKRETVTAGVDQPLLESYLDLSARGGQVDAIFLEAVATDQDRVVRTLMGDDSNPAERETY